MAGQAWPQGGSHTSWALSTFHQSLRAALRIARGANPLVPDNHAIPALVAGPLRTDRTLIPIYRSLGIVILPGEPEGVGGWHLYQSLPLQHPFQGHTLQP